MPSRTPYHMLMRALPLPEVKAGKVALILIDVQAFTASREGELADEARRRGVFGEFEDYFTQVDAALRNIPLLTVACRHSGIAVVHARVSGAARLSRQFRLGELSRPHIAFGPDQSVGGIIPAPGDITIERGGYSVFHNTGLEDRLHQAGIGTLILAGMMSNITVSLAAREATDRDFDVLVVGDASPGETMEWHATTMQGLTGGAIRVVSTLDMIDIIVGRKS